MLKPASPFQRARFDHAEGSDHAMEGEEKTGRAETPEEGEI